MAPEVVLLGDSIFDNGVCVAGGPDVGQQLGERLPPRLGSYPLGL